MGGHSKKSGRGGGGSSRQHRCRANPHHPAGAKKTLAKDPGVPDLRKIAAKMTQVVSRRNNSLLSLRPGAAAASIRPQQEPQHSMHPMATHSFDEEGASEAESIARGRREMTALALRSTERQHEFTAPMGLRHPHASELFNSNNNSNNASGEDYYSEAAEDEGAAADRRGADRSLRRFYKQLQQVVESCDVILEVVDARDPLGCRLTQLEQNIRSTYGDTRKKVVVVLNKVDLLPSRRVADLWIQYFQKEAQLLCVPFSARVGGATGQAYVHELFKQLRGLARSGVDGARKAIVVGVIGYPNVGKSSIINALRRKAVVGVANTPGFTTGNTEVELRSDIRILDCPGVVSPGEDTGDVILRNAVRLSNVSNPFPPLQRLLERCTTVHAMAPEEGAPARGLHPLAALYGIGTFPAHDVSAFLQLVGHRRGRLTKGGQVDEEATARMVLSDWNDGRIAYYTYPPKADDFFTRPSGDFRARRVSSLSGEHSEEAGESGTGAGQAPELVSGLAEGITMDGLPVFHLQLNTTALSRGLNRKKRWIQRYHAEQEAGEEENEGEAEDEEVG